MTGRPLRAQKFAEPRRLIVTTLPTVTAGTPGSGRATGVIDWGDVSAGDPSADLSIAYGAFVGPARAAFLQAYGPIDGLTELRGRVIATFLAAALLGYAADRGMDALREDSLRSLERVVA